MPTFVFKVNDEVLYRTKLESVRCVEHTVKGSRCKRICVFGSPFCSAHLASLHYLQIKPSRIPHAGKGLYAVHPRDSNSNEVLFRRGEIICAYKGEVINKEELVDRYSDKTPPYVVGVSENVYEDGARIRGIGSLANTNAGHTNATISVYRGRASLKATRSIRSGDEIYLAYGRAYKLHQPGVESYTTAR